MKILDCSVARDGKRKASMTVALCCRLGLLVPLAAAIYASVASATNVPITFENPPYSTGAVVGKDGWTADFGLDSANVTVVNSSPIQGAQSLRVTGPTEFARSSVFSVPVPTDMSWLVRVDAFGTGNFESGLIDPVSGGTPLAMAFPTNGHLQYYNGTANSDFPGSPLYGLSTVYRVELHNIAPTTNTVAPFGTYDASVFNNSTNSLVASKTALPLASAIPSTGIGFYAIHFGSATGVALVDNITATVPIPDPTLQLQIINVLGSGNVIESTKTVLVNSASGVSFNVDSYVIESATGSLNPAGFNGFAGQNVAGWESVAPSANALSELNLTSSTTLSPGAGRKLGAAFTTGATKDLAFHFHLVGSNTVTTGTVVYKDQLAGDYNENGKVDAADYIVWRKGLGTTYDQTDYQIWRAHFGLTPAGSGSLTSRSVPEPATMVLLVAGIPLMCARRRALAL